MRVTYPETCFGFWDSTALADGQVVSSSAQRFSDPDLFKDNIRQAIYGTMELNQFVLDGSRQIFPEEPEDVPYWSNEISDETGIYEKTPSLEIVFSKAHSSIGLTLYFGEDIPREVRITWYTLYGTKLQTDTFYPDSREYFCSKNVQNYEKIVIEFIRSTLPCRYARMNYIEYGQKWNLGKDSIKSASVYEEIDPTSATLSINTAQIEIVDPNGKFEMTNPEGLWRFLQKEQEISLVEYVNGIPMDCGTFYLNEWNCQQNVVNFSMVDPIGVMDKTKFYKGTIYDHARAGDIITDIMESCGIRKYSIEEEVYYTELTGWLAIQSHRAALQQVVFACGAVADCSRGSWVRIYKPDRYVSHTIDLNHKFQGTKVTLDDYTSSVEVSYSHYILAVESKQISKSVLPAGSTTIEFEDPYFASSITASAGKITETATNYVVINMDKEAECIVSGKKYEAIENAYTASVTIMEAGEKAKTKTYKGCTLMDAVKAKDTAERILDYYQLRQIVEMRYINEGEAVGNWCNVAQAAGGHSATGITGQTLDLTGGNIATATCRGYSKVLTVYDYTGNEIYAGERGLI